MNSETLNSKSGSPEELAQELFDRSYKEVERDAHSVAREALWRRIVAYGFKIVAGGGGIAISLDVPHTKLIGITILVVVFLDAVFSNHEKLLVTVEARNAFRRLLRAIRSKHDNGILLAVQFNKKGEKDTACQTIIDLCNELKCLLDQEKEVIHKSLEDADLAALRKISVDDSKKKLR